MYRWASKADRLVVDWSFEAGFGEDISIIAGLGLSESAMDSLLHIFCITLFSEDCLVFSVHSLLNILTQLPSREM